MTLKFEDSTDPIKVEHLIVTITSPPGIGKTSLASSAEHPILLDADQGAHRTPYRAPRLTLASWDDCLAVHEHPKVLEASTVVVDTIGRVVDLCCQKVIEEKAKNTIHNGALIQGGWGVVKGRMIPWLNNLRATGGGKDLVLLSHLREEKKRDDLIVRPDITGGTLQEVLKVSDLIGYLSLVGGKRTLDFNPQDDRLGKNSANLPPFLIPDFASGKRTILADILAQAKAAMTTQTAESAKAESAVADWKAQIETITDAQGADNTLESLNHLEDGPVKAQAKTLLAARVKTLGLVYDKTAKAFVPKVAA